MAPACKTCGGPLGKGRIYCSNPCRLAGLNSKPRQRTVGLMKPRLTRKGYMRAWVWQGDKLKAVLVHRWVMEQHLGRALRPDERVHHINGDRTDNRLENLELYSSHSAHLDATHTPRRVMERMARRAEVAAMVHDGWSQSEIARTLGVSEATISHDLAPLGLRARADHFSPSTRSR